MGRMNLSSKYEILSIKQCSANMSQAHYYDLFGGLTLKQVSKIQQYSRFANLCFSA